MIPKSLHYCVFGPDGIIIARGNAGDMRRLRKARGNGYTIGQGGPEVGCLWPWRQIPAGQSGFDPERTLRV